MLQTSKISNHRREVITGRCIKGSVQQLAKSTIRNARHALKLCTYCIEQCRKTFKSQPTIEPIITD